VRGYGFAHVLTSDDRVITSDNTARAMMNFALPIRDINIIIEIHDK
jgi:hypothetical protein